MSLVNIYKFMLLRKQKQGKNQNSQIFEKSFFSLKYVSSLWKFYRNESCALKKIFYRNKSCALKKIFDRNKSCTLKKICKFLLLFLTSYMNGMSEINLYCRQFLVVNWTSNINICDESVFAFFEQRYFFLLQCETNNSLKKHTVQCIL